ncbi:MAG: methyltransferase domain-containing protein [Candidatus Pacebacteria bacterium]|nr:methyltransferase domain-containing protein [Candidatus Paceibacterota bacterium]
MFKEYYDRYWHQRIGEKILPPIRSFIPGFLKPYTSYGAILNSLPRGRILDLGCGDGNVSQLYLKKGEVYGLDISSEALKQAKKRGIKTRQGDLNQSKLPYSSNFFQAVILTDVLEHLIDPVKTLKETRRVLKKGGRLILTVPNFARLKNRLRMIWGDPIDLLHWSKYGDEVEHLHWFTRPKLVYLLKKVEFGEIKFVPTGLPLGFFYGLMSLPQLGNFLTIVAEK